MHLPGNLRVDSRLTAHLSKHFFVSRELTQIASDALLDRCYEVALLLALLHRARLREGGGGAGGRSSMRKPRGPTAGASGDEAGPLAEGTPPPKKRGRRANEGAGAAMEPTTTTKKTSASRPPCPHGLAPRGRCEVFRVPARSAKVQVRQVRRLGGVHARTGALPVQGLRRQGNVRAPKAARAVQGVRRARHLRAREAAEQVRGVRRERHLRARAATAALQGVRRVCILRARSSEKQMRDVQSEGRVMRIGAIVSTEKMNGDDPTPLRNNITSISCIDDATGAATRAIDPPVAHRPVVYRRRRRGGGVCKSPRLLHRASTAVSTAVHRALPSGGSSPTGSAHQPGAV